jgi:uncharacterized YigZ family protein
MDDVYYTIRKPERCEIKIKGSRFLSESEIVASADEVQIALEKIRKREHSATHHCYAYRLGLFEKTRFKYSDDGEPSGTAGSPIYDVIRGRKLTNILVVVTRYFGGTKLGTGGLVKAYSDAASKVIDLSGIRECYLMEHFNIEMDFSFYDLIAKLLPRFDANKIKATFSDHVLLELEVRKSKAELLLTEITELSSGNAKVQGNKGVEDT